MVGPFQWTILASRQWICAPWQLWFRAELTNKTLCVLERTLMAWVLNARSRCTCTKKVKQKFALSLDLVGLGQWPWALQPTDLFLCTISQPLDGPSIHSIHMVILAALCDPLTSILRFVLWVILQLYLLQLYYSCSSMLTLYCEHSQCFIAQSLTVPVVWV